MSERMFYIKRREFVQVYAIYDKSALIFDPAVAAKNNGHGWITVNVNSLIPEEYADMNSKSGFISKSEEKRRAEARVILVSNTSNTWECSDGLFYTGKDSAVKHEILLIRQERQVSSCD